MLPITLGVIGTKSSKSSFQSFLLASIYVLGIALTYSVLGVFAALTGSLFGSALQNPYIIGSISILFVLMGLSMLDVFYVQAPLELQNKLSKIYQKQGKGSLVGVFIMGLISGLIATPCVGPVIVSMLTFVAQTKNVFLGFWLLFTFAIGMGLILVLFGTFSNRLINLPKAGTWMETIKKFMAIIMFGVAFYYIKPIIPSYLFNLLLGASIITLGTFMGASIKIEIDSPPKVKLQKSSGIMILSVGLYMFVNALADKAMLGNNFNLGSTSQNIALVESTKTESDVLTWKTSETEGLKIAQAENKYVMLDFYADWCAACHELDKYTYTDKKVIKELSNFVPIKIDATKNTPEIQKLFEKYQILGLPAVIFLDKKGKILEDYSLSGFEKPEDFIKRLMAVNK
jgi:thiol:disulfide interchange protein DsbD